MSLPDYSAWLTPERLAIEEKLWEECGYYKWYAKAVRMLLPDTGGSIIEFGCGTGWVPGELMKQHNFAFYRGVDANAECLALARAKYASDPRIQFEQCDIRNWLAPKKAMDVSCAFAFLKHFSLAEIDMAIAVVLWPSWNGVFTIPPAEEDFDDGVEFPHTHLSMATIERAVRAANRRIETTYMLPNEELVVITRA